MYVSRQSVLSISICSIDLYVNILLIEHVLSIDLDTAYRSVEHIDIDRTYRSKEHIDIDRTDWYIYGLSMSIHY